MRLSPQLIDFSTTANKLDHFVRLNRDAHSDIEWWACFIEPWIAVLLMEAVVGKQPELTIVSDTSGSWGCGAVWGSCWFQVKWMVSSGAHIAIKEMVPAVITTAIWGRTWTGKWIRILTDNFAVVAALNSNTSRVP